MTYTLYNQPPKVIPTLPAATTTTNITHVKYYIEVKFLNDAGEAELRYLPLYQSGDPSESTPEEKFEAFKEKSFFHIDDFEEDDLGAPNIVLFSGDIPMSRVIYAALRDVRRVDHYTLDV